MSTAAPHRLRRRRPRHADDLEVALGAIGGWDVSLCADGEEALIVARAERPDLLLLDASMPGIDGRRTLQLLRSDPGLRDIPVVFVTGHAAPDEVAAFVRDGALGVLAKPFDPMQLAARVRDLWERRPQ